jgi:hypothetical protein
MSTETEEAEQRIQLNHQHEKEWNDLLAQDIRTRIALNDKHQREHNQSYLDEINFRDRALLTNHQLVEIKELSRANRAVRISMRKRHALEDQELSIANDLPRRVEGENIVLG